MNKAGKTNTLSFMHYSRVAGVCLALGLLASCARGPAPKPIESAQQPTQPSTSEATEPYKPAEVPPQQSVKIAMLLPTSGQYRALGESMMDAGMLALDDKYKTLSEADRQKLRIILIPKDTQTDAGLAMRSAQEATKEGAQLILGPVFSRSLEAVAPITRPQMVPVLSFSNNTALGGSGVYVLGFTPDEQIRRVLNYASAQGARKVAALLPQDAYGDAINKVLQEQGNALGGVEIVSTAFYQPNSPTMTTELAQLFGLPAPGSTLPEEAPSDAPKAEVPQFDALLVPEGGQALNRVAEGMKLLSINRENLMLLGSGQWDDERVVLDSSLQGGIFAGTDPEKFRRFKRHFMSVYGYPPERLASLAYDSVALVATLAYQQVMSGAAAQGVDLTPSRLETPEGFEGPVDGIFRFRSDGTVERGLAVVQVTAEGPKVVDPAPHSF